MISHEKKYIFVQNMKCACSAMRVALEPWNSMGHGGHYTARQLKNGDLPQRFFDGCAARGDEVSADDFGKHWDEYFTFGFVRNPWDHFLSWYSYTAKQLNVDFSFEQFVMEPERQGHSLKMWDFSGLFDRISDNGEVILDFVGRFEQLDTDWEKICLQVGVPFTPLTKVNASGERPHYSTFYSDEMMEKVGEIYGEDAKKFGYEFEDRR